MAKTLLLLLLLLAPVALAPVAAAAPASPALFARCQTPVAGVNCVAPNGWYCWVWVDGVVTQVCYRPL